MDGARNKLLACPGFARDQNGGVCGSNLRNKREYFLQGARTPDDLVAHRSLIDFFGQGDVLVFQSLFGLLWIRDDYCDASHELLPNLGTLHARYILLFIARIVEPVSSANNPRWSRRVHHIGTEGIPFRLCED